MMALLLRCRSFLLLIKLWSPGQSDTWVGRIFLTRRYILIDQLANNIGIKLSCIIQQ